MREQVVRLEDDPDPPSRPILVDALGGQLLGAEKDAALVDRLQQVHAAQERRLARAGGADQAHDLVLGEGEVDSVEDTDVAEGLRHSLEAKVRGHRRRFRSRAISQSVKRVIGIVSARKITAVAT